MESGSEFEINVSYRERHTVTSIFEMGRGRTRDLVTVFDGCVAEMAEANNMRNEKDKEQHTNMSSQFH